MKAQTRLHKRVLELVPTLPCLSADQIADCMDRAINHWCKRNDKSNTNECVDCGHKWKGDKVEVCPHCGAKFTDYSSMRKTRFSDVGTYGVIQTSGEFTVVRKYIVQKMKYAKTELKQFVTETSQEWVADSGKKVLRAKPLAMCPYYRRIPFRLDCDMSIRRQFQSYNDNFYHFTPDCIYGKIQVSKMLQRNGIKTSLHGHNPEMVFVALLTNSRFETMWKAGLFKACSEFLYRGAGRIDDNWPQIKLMIRHKKKVKDFGMWLDYLELLKFFEKDLNSPKWLFPDNLKKAHDKYSDKKDKFLKEERDRQRKLEIQKKIDIFNAKSKYFDVAFSDKNIDVIVLKSIDEYKNEADHLGHCVYSREYWGEENTLIMSARLKRRPTKPVETIEIALDTGKILQCYGYKNGESKYHDEIMSLCKSNAYKITRITANGR